MLFGLSCGCAQVGAFGIKWLLMALSDNDEAQAAYSIMATETYPSFGYMMSNRWDNATTV